MFFFVLFNSLISRGVFAAFAVEYLLFSSFQFLLV